MGRTKRVGKKWGIAFWTFVMALFLYACGSSQSGPTTGTTTGTTGGTTATTGSTTGTTSGTTTGSTGGGGSTTPMVIRWHNDLGGTGLNDHETILTPASVSSSQFGKLFDLTDLDGAAYAQPLYVPGLSIKGATHNVLFVATSHDMLYAYDADAKGPALWQRQLIDKASGETYLDNPEQDTGKVCCPDHAIGIIGTPVIDTASNTLYVVARTKIPSPRTYFQKLYAIDILTGATKVVHNIDGQVSGNGDANFFPDAPSTVTFDRPFDKTGDGIVETHENQRAGLLLLGSNVYVTWASHTDIHPYHGWVMAFDKSTLSPTGIFCVTPNRSVEAGGIWMSGAAPASDGTSIFLATGNGDWGPDQLNYSMSVLRMNPNLTVADYFTPYNWSTLNQTDLDLAASNPMLLPDQAGPVPHLLIQTGKDGTIYLINRDAMGNLQANDTQVVQKIPRALPGVVRSSPAYWNGYVYWAGGLGSDEIVGTPPGDIGKMDTLRAYRFQNGQLSTTPVSVSAAHYFFPGATPSVSSNGATNGIVWTMRNPQGGGRGILEAYDATNLANLLFNSDAVAANQTGGSFVRFVVPTVVNGKVYVSTANNAEANGRISVYGMKQ